MEVLRRGADLGLPDATVKNLCDGWTEDELNWHRRTMQLAHHMPGLGLTPAVRVWYRGLLPLDGPFRRMACPAR